MHTVIDALCTGCDLCVPVCPVDCISLVESAATATGWDAWSAAQAAQARERYALAQLRSTREQREHDARLQAKARPKLADSTGTSTITEPPQPAQARVVAGCAGSGPRAAPTRHKPPSR